MALPTVTASDLHTVQLDPKLRKILARRARRANQREYAPVLAADRAALQAPRQTYRREAKGVRAATNMVENTLANALAGLRDSGLKGGYLKQAIHELTARQGDAAATAPFLLADARENRDAALADAAQQLRSDRAAMLQGSAADFNQLLKEARTTGSSQLEKQETRDRSARHEKATEEAAASKELDAALSEVRRLLTAYPEEAPSDNREWNAFMGTVAKAEGVGLQAAIKATEQVRRELAAERKAKLHALAPGLNW